MNTLADIIGSYMQGIFKNWKDFILIKYRDKNLWTQNFEITRIYSAKIGQLLAILFG